MGAKQSTEDPYASQQDNTPPGAYNAPNTTYNDNDQDNGKRNECNDVFFLLIWIGLVIMTLVFAIKYGNEFVSATKFQDAVVEGYSGYGKVLELVAYCGLAALGFSFVWTAIMALCGQFLIWLALWVIVAMYIIAAVAMTSELHKRGESWYWWPAVVFGLLALLTLLYMFCVRNRIKFASAHLYVSGKALFTLPMTVVVAFVMVFVQFGWVVTWVVGTGGLAYTQGYITVEGDSCTASSCKIETNAGPIIGIVFGMFFVLDWGCIVVNNIVSVTVAGAVASWKIRTTTPCMTMTAWLRAVTLNLGSICFGSLIVAILETIKQTLNFIASIFGNSGNCCAACIVGCVACCVGCIENAIQIFNRYAYVYVGVHGYSFITAGKHVTEMFAQKGWSMIVNDDLTGNVLWLGKIAVGALSAWMGWGLAKHNADGSLSNISEPEWIVGFGAFLIGYAVCNVFMNVISGSVATIFVLWAEDPFGWQVSHPDAYEKLDSAWREVYPNEYNNGNGKMGAA